jgi:hypothetical protein
MLRPYESALVPFRNGYFWTDAKWSVSWSRGVLAGEEKTLLDKPVVPPWRPASLEGGGEYATVFQPKRTKRRSTEDAKGHEKKA